METERGVSPEQEAARRKAYSAVIHSKKYLEYLHQFLWMILEIKKMQAKAFNKRVVQVLKLLQETSDVSESMLRQLTGGIERLGMSLEDFIVALSESDNAMLWNNFVNIIKGMCGIDHWKPQMFKRSRVTLEQVKQTLQEIDLIDEQMKRFLNDTDLDKVLEDLYRYIDVHPAREMVKGLSRASGKLKRDTAILLQVTTETTILCEELEFLLDFLRKSVDLCRDIEFMIFIESVAGYFEDFLTARGGDPKECIDRLGLFCDGLTHSQAKEDIKKGMILPIEELMKKIYNQDIGYIFLEGLRKILFIRERIEVIKCNT